MIFVNSRLPFFSFRYHHPLSCSNLCSTFPLGNLASVSSSRTFILQLAIYTWNDGPSAIYPYSFQPQENPLHTDKKVNEKGLYDVHYVH